MPAAIALNTQHSRRPVSWGAQCISLLAHGLVERCFLDNLELGVQSVRLQAGCMNDCS